MASLFFVILFLFTTPSLLAQSDGLRSKFENRTIIAKGDYHFPPYEFINAQGEPDGFNVELFKEVMHRLGLKYQLTLDDWGTVRDELENGEIDMLIGIINSSERARNIRFGVPHCLITFNIISRKSDSYSSMESLRGKKLMAQYKDLAYEYLIDTQLTDHLVPTNTVQKGLEILSEGANDAFIALTMVSYHFLKQGDFPNLKSSNSNILPSPYSMAVRPDNEDLLFLLNNTIYQMKIDGDYDRLYYKWFNVYEKSDAYETIRLVLLLSISIMVVLAVFIWFLRSRIHKATAKLQKKNQETLRLVEELQEENRMRLSIENSLLMAKQKAEEGERLKSAFLANMSHEIRTPLNAIVGFSELLKYAENDLEKEEYLEIINTNNELLLQLISDILDLSKIESGSIQLHPQPMDITEFIKEIYATIKVRCETKGIQAILDNPFDKFVATLDKNKCLQVVTNYLNNAMKFTKNGYIKLGYDYREGGVLFFVEDTGIGLSKENLEHLFQRFGKLDTFTQGTGLGLSICKGLIENMGGRVWAESEQGKGATFFAWIPCSAEIEKPA
ncbi:MAG: transporter substrate-binding domain-containing protein [Phocaeicola sp.]